MRKTKKTFITVFAALMTFSASAFAFAACDILENVAGLLPHTHKWGDWQQSTTEHWRTCSAWGCSVKEERGEHSGSPCEVCGPAFKAVAFYTVDTYIDGVGDHAHVSFVREANTWFAEAAEEYNFTYDHTGDWTNMNEEFLSDYDLVLFLDSRPEDSDQRDAFENYMRSGGAWIGFHFSAFALDNSAYPQNWDWYHDEFIGAGEYADNTWAPTAETLRVETHDHPATANLPETFEATVCEWYSWEYDLRENPDITILASIDESSFPVGNNPGEIWNEGYYPVIWANNNYNMLYLNMGHNMVTYGVNSQDLSSSFSSEAQNQLLIDAMFGLTSEN